ncbi:flagellar assembly protein FliW [Vallitalea okinawensis]|uniref:flagellar assembly protein FliW n=1 Tax=Vallitalea okinawensis TaxID=2078660 RepID=UPI000CFD230C|nr:flagellar assembly protein FliW [Vallitalea okinawensis]
MEIKTRNFGTIEIEDDQILTFEDGIPGFEKLNKFALINDKKDYPFAFLQCVSDGDISLTIINPYDLIKDYSFEVDDTLIENLGQIKENNLAIYVVVVIPDNIEKITANLKAPIIINIEAKKGIQVALRNDNYQIKHPVFNELLACLSTEEEEIC